MGLTNIQMKCCEIEQPVESCKPKDFWEEVVSCSSNTDTKCSYYEKIGATMDRMEEMTGSEMRSMEKVASVSVGGGVSFLGFGLKTEFTAGIGMSSSTGLDWSQESSAAFDKAKEVRVEFDIPAKTKTIIYQIVGTCGIFEVRTSRFFRSDTKVGEKVVKPYLLPNGFFCGDNVTTHRF